MLIIGITGKLGTGKDYVANHIIKPTLKSLGLEFIHIAFADAIKIEVMATHNITFNECYIRKTDTTRRLLQTVGTSQREINPNIWINHVKAWIDIQESRGVKAIIISDCRFLNEYEFIKSKGGIVIQVIAPNRNHERLLQESNGSIDIYRSISTHISETDLEETQPDMVIYNDTNDIMNIETIQQELILHIPFQNQ